MWTPTLIWNFEYNKNIKVHYSMTENKNNKKISDLILHYNGDKIYAGV